MRAAFCTYGALKKVHVMKEKKCAFVTFAEREEAEEAAKQKCGALGFEINGVKMKCMWGKSKSESKKKKQAGGEESKEKKKENLTDVEKLEQMRCRLEAEEEIREHGRERNGNRGKVSRIYTPSSMYCNKTI